MADYSFSERLLHRIALGTPMLRQISFDIEQQISRPALTAARNGDHVVISGLARAGTSILLRCLASTGSFAAQTYRDMPFPLAPGLWSKITKNSRKQAILTERAHGDRLEVGFDSEEAFEEVFWLTMAGKDYVRPDALVPHEVDLDTADAYAAFVASVLAANPPAGRYLAKNNNNCLRLSGVKRALPNATLIVPFRDPVQHAVSLMRQHERFVGQHRSNSFSRAYMGWLGHFEFGLDHKPFGFEEAPEGTPNELGYWLDLWAKTYRGILNTAPQETLFWDFDAFCADPQTTIGKLSAKLVLESPVAPELLAQVSLPSPHTAPVEISTELLKDATSVHHNLKIAALA